jgi:hypothetical protein
MWILLFFGTLTNTAASHISHQGKKGKGKAIPVTGREGP